MILLNIRRNKIDNIETPKNSKPKLFWNKIILIEKEKITNSSNEVIKKETVLVNNDEIAKTFNKHFAETVQT